MMKKTFKENLGNVLTNPALAFIDTAHGQEQEEPSVAAPTKKPSKTHSAAPKKVVAQMESTAKPLESPSEGFTANRKRVETKSSKILLLLQPSLHEKIRAGAAREESSVNDYIHAILELAHK